eukprot:g461.t1
MAPPKPDIGRPSMAPPKPGATKSLAFPPSLIPITTDGNDVAEYASKKPGKATFKTLAIPDLGIETRIEEIEEPQQIIAVEGKGESISLIEDDPPNQIAIITEDEPALVVKPGKANLKLSVGVSEDTPPPSLVLKPRNSLSADGDASPPMLTAKPGKPKLKLGLSESSSSEGEKAKKSFVPLKNAYQHMEITTDIAFLEDDDIPALEVKASSLPPTRATTEAELPALSLPGKKGKPSLSLGNGDDTGSRAGSSTGQGAKLTFDLTLEPSGLETDIAFMEEDDGAAISVGDAGGGGGKKKLSLLSPTPENTDFQISIGSDPSENKRKLSVSTNLSDQRTSASSSINTISSDRVKFSPTIRPIIHSLSASYGYLELECAQLLARKVNLEIIMPTEH